MDSAGLAKEDRADISASILGCNDAVWRPHLICLGPFWIVFGHTWVLAHDVQTRLNGDRMWIFPRSVLTPVLFIIFKMFLREIFARQGLGCYYANDTCHTRKQINNNCQTHNRIATHLLALWLVNWRTISTDRSCTSLYNVLSERII